MEEENKTPVEVTTPTEEQPNPTNPVEPTVEEKPADEGKESKPKGEGQSRDLDAKFARERHEREIKKAQAMGDAEGYRRARIKSVGGKNPYADDSPIETDEDYELYELQDEIAKNGGDPKSVREVNSLRISKQKDAQEKAKAEADAQVKNQENTRAEIQECIKAGYTDQQIREYLRNNDFLEITEKYFQKGVDLLTAIEIYEVKKGITKPTQNETKGKKDAANRMSSPGGSSNNEGDAAPKIPSFKNREEFSKYLEDVKSGKRKIE